MIKNDGIKMLVKKCDENRLAHVFLIETNDKDATLMDILEFCKVLNCSDTYVESCSKCNICHLINQQQLPSLKIIYPDGQAIKKEQMENLKNAFFKIPYLTKYNCYIIMEAEKLNSSSANTMLKFIEEPEANTIGFLVTNNKENVIETIKSRCEIIKCYYDTLDGKKKNERLFSLAEDYLYKLEVEKNKSILYNKVIIDEKLEREDVRTFYQIILSIYMDVLNGKTLDNRPDKINKLSQKEILKRIYLVNEVIERLNYNVNINLLMDYFVLGLED